jgi:hypothetical protein
VTSADQSTTLFPHYINYGGTSTDAYWTPSGILYGTGIVPIEIVGHEMFHGVLLTASNATLNYPSGQPGALQEAYCDIFGAMVQRYVFGESNDTWKIGAAYYTPNISGDAIRFINYPHLSANMIGMTTNGNPDHMNEYYNGSGDNYGIHVNIGIPEKAFYLLAKGGQSEFGGPILTGLGADVASTMWYVALWYSNPFTDFSGHKTNLARAARSLYNCTTCIQYAEAMNSWVAVGVGSAVNATLNITFSDFELTELPWYLFGPNAVLWVNAGNGTVLGYHSSRGFIQLGGYTGYSGTAYSGPWNISPVATGATLSFYLNIVSTDTTNPGPDTLSVQLKDSVTGNLLTTLATFTNLSPKNTWKLCSYPNLQAYSSYNLLISFAVFNSLNSPTTFYLDNVLLQQTLA